LVPIELEQDVQIPPGIGDVNAFRRWATSDDFPERGRFAFLGHRLWVDLTMEQIFTHNLVKTRISSALDSLVVANGFGYYHCDGVLLTHPEVGLSTEPDGVFVSYESLRRGRVQLTQGKAGGYVELVGSPDMILEVVSDRSVHKDTVELRRLYFEAGVPEYWLVDARGATPQFDLLRRGRRLYRASRRQEGWVRSAVFDRAFRLTQQTDPLGHPQYQLQVRS
jgi:Uma2 family endonuclease